MPLYRMCPDDLVIQLDAEARTIGNGDRSLDEQLVRLEDFRPPVHLSPLELEQAEIFQYRADLNARGRRDWAARIVRGHFDAVRFGHCGDTRELEQASAVFDVGHDHVDGM